MKAQNILETIGRTPHVRIQRLFGDLSATGQQVWIKCERANPGGSIKDRIGLAMIEAAERAGALQPGGTIVEPTSGNTGIGLAFTAAVHGFRCIFVMPDTMTLERRAMLRALGAELVLTEGAKGIRAAIEKAEEIAAGMGGGAWIPRQFDNPANPQIHYRTTGPEIWEDTQGRIDVLVAGVGTGGTLTGSARFLREKKPDLHVVAVEPAESAVLSGGEPSPHKQQGIGTGFIPGVLDTTIYNEVVPVTNEDAFATTRRLARHEGILAGISSGSITWAALEVARRPEMAGKLIVAVIPDFGERYLSNPVYAEMEAAPAAPAAG